MAVWQARIAVMVLFPACRLQLSSRRGELERNIFVCHASGSKSATRASSAGSSAMARLVRPSIMSLLQSHQRTGHGDTCIRIGREGGSNSKFDLFPRCRQQNVDLWGIGKLA